MREAVIADLQTIPNVCIDTLDHVPSSAEAEIFQALAASSEAVFAIAPESHGLLEERYHWTLSAGSRWLGSSAAAIRLTGNKLALARFWQSRQIPTPMTLPITDWPAGRFPAVIKPVDGAGSTATFRVDSPQEFSLAVELARSQGETVDRLLAQDFIPGHPASVAMLIQGETVIVLRPTFQYLSADGRFRYLGGEVPMPSALEARAVSLAERAVAGIPGLAGYVGIDLILGDAGDGSEDVAMEVNPRLTTSYVGLRALSQDCLGALLWQWFDAGITPPPIRWKSNRIRFHADGRVERGSVPEFDIAANELQ